MTNYSLTPETGKVEAKGQPVTLKHVAEWWVWNWPYLVVFILATLGSLIFGFLPGWGGVVSAVCTIIATVTGFKAGMKYHREVIQRPTPRSTLGRDRASPSSPCSAACSRSPRRPLPSVRGCCGIRRR